MDDLIRLKPNHICFDAVQDVLGLLQAREDLGAALTALDSALGSGETLSVKLVQKLTQVSSHQGFRQVENLLRRG